MLQTSQTELLLVVVVVLLLLLLLLLLAAAAAHATGQSCRRGALQLRPPLPGQVVCCTPARSDLLLCCRQTPLLL